MSELLDRHNAVMGLDAPLFYEEPIQLVRGEGVWLFDEHDNRFLDLYNNVPCVGHANPRVVEAMKRQMATLNVHSRYLHENVIAYAERLVDLHHDGLTSMIFACTGSEANEVAMMMARVATGKLGIIGTDATYHGNTPEVAKLTHLPVDGKRQGVGAIATPQRFRPLVDGLDDRQLCDLHIGQLEDRINEFEADGPGFAGVLLCSILANEGLAEAPTGFFGRAVDVVHDAGGLVIADEVQAGFGRSGSWWGYQTSGFVPDIVTLGKPMGNGLPVAGVVASHDLVTGFRRKHRYFNTFAASPLQAAAGSAVIDEIEDRKLVARADRIGERIRAELGGLADDDPRMGDSWGLGMFTGIDWVVPGTTEPDVAGAGAMVEAMKSRNILMGRAGQHGNVLKIRPPLVFDDEHADLFLGAFADALSSVD
ncbi:MAG: aspartate aminotransferase family protein [Acidimicrobiales bacterium]